MANVKFIIDKSSFENILEDVFYSDNELYKTKRISADGETTFDGYVSGYMIKNGQADGIPSSDYFDFVNAVDEVMMEHNEQVNSESGFSVEFKILDKDSRHAYKYQEYVNGKLIKEGTGWSKDFKTEIERKAWIKAVNEYKTAKGIEKKTEKLKKKLEKIKNKIGKMDANIPEAMSFQLPTMMAAMPELSSNVCQFVSDVTEAGKQGVATIAGMPSPKDVMNYNIKVVKNNIAREVTKTYDSQAGLVQPVFKQVSEPLDESTEYFDELDALYDEERKRLADEVALFETVLEPPYEYKPPVLVYDAGDGNEGDGGGYLIDDADLKYTPQPGDGAVDYGDITFDRIFSRGAGYKLKTDFTGANAVYNDIPRGQARQNVIEMMRYLLVPIKKGWETYCKNKKQPAEIRITSGYRPYYYNTAIHGSQTSAHTYGLAVDCQPYFTSSDKVKRVNEFAAYIKAFLSANRSIQFDQILVERNNSGGKWVHIGYKNRAYKQRRQFYADFDANGAKGSHKYEAL